METLQTMITSPWYIRKVDKPESAPAFVNFAIDVKNSNEITEDDIDQALSNYTRSIKYVQTSLDAFRLENYK